MKSITPVFLCAFFLTTACGNQDTAPSAPAGNTGGETEIIAPVTPAPADTSSMSAAQKMSVGDLRAVLNDVSANTPLTELSEMARATADKLPAKDLQDLSNAFWAGKAGVSRNRTASTALAKAAYTKNKETWSQLRTGIGYINGTGVEQDTAKAIDLLSDSSLASNPAAAYFLSLAHKEAGNTAGERDALLRAQSLGHGSAAKRLAELNR